MEYTEKYLKTGLLTQNTYIEILKYAYVYIDNSSFVHAKLNRKEFCHDMVVYTIEKLARYNSKLSAVKTYIYQIFRAFVNKTYRAHLTQKRRFDYILNDEDGETNLFDFISFSSFDDGTESAANDKYFIEAVLQHWKDKADNYFVSGGKYNKAIKRIIKLLIDCESLKVNGKGTFITEELKISKTAFHLLLTQMRKINKRLYGQWLNEGQI